MVIRLCYVHNLDTFNAICRKGQRLCYVHNLCQKVERLCYVHNIDILNGMSKGLKDYVMYTI